MAAFAFAVAFETALSLTEMIERLNQKHPRWDWIEWQNDTWGDYIRGIRRVIGDPSFKILFDDEIDSWAINASYDHQTRVEMDELVATKLLPSLDAIGTRPLTDDYSS